MAIGIVPTATLDHIPVGQASRSSSPPERSCLLHLHELGRNWLTVAALVSSALATHQRAGGTEVSRYRK
jgi:hypothetical protein